MELTTREIADRYGVSRQRVNQWIETYGIQYRRVGRLLVVKESELRKKIPKHRPTGVRHDQKKGKGKP